MSYHAKNGLTTVIIRLVFLAIALAGLFHFFMYIMFRPASEPVTKNSQKPIQPAAPVTENPVQATVADKMIKPGVSLMRYAPTFKPKELVSPRKEEGNY